MTRRETKILPSDKFSKWDLHMPAEDLRSYRAAGFGNRVGFGDRPALLNVDTHNLFIDPASPFCCTDDPEGLETALVTLTDVFRRLELPIYYVRRDDRDHPVKRGIREFRYESLRTSSTDDPSRAHDPEADKWRASYAPRQEDVIVYKNKSSAFFGTPLQAWLRYHGVDTLVVCGMATGGCVRATVTDAFANNFRVIVAAEACADRSERQHLANLFDMDMKLADVMNLHDVVSYLEARHDRAASEAARPGTVE